MILTLPSSSFPSCHRSILSKLDFVTQYKVLRKLRIVPKQPFASAKLKPIQPTSLLSLLLLHRRLPPSFPIFSSVENTLRSFSTCEGNARAGIKVGLLLKILSFHRRLLRSLRSFFRTTNILRTCFPTTFFWGCLCTMHSSCLCVFCASKSPKLTWFRSINFTPFYVFLNTFFT